MNIKVLGYNVDIPATKFGNVATENTREVSIKFVVTDDFDCGVDNCSQLIRFLSHAANEFCNGMNSGINGDTD